MLLATGLQNPSSARAYKEWSRAFRHRHAASGNSSAVVGESVWPWLRRCQNQFVRRLRARHRWRLGVTGA